MTHTHVNIEDKILHQAADWFATLQDENLSEEERQQWLAWLDADTRHQQAWEQIEEVSGSFDKFNRDVNRRVARKALSGSKQGVFNNLFVFFLVCISTSLGWYALSPQPLQLNAVSYQTAVGETREIHLEDGTKLWLNTDSEITSIYSDKLRKIMLSRGEVLVNSAPDTQHPYRPLVVDTENGRLTALGTRFSVRHNNADTELTVFEGTVRIEPAESLAQEIIPAGQQGRFEQSRIMQTGTAADPARQAWTRGILLADDMPLCNFITELNRYRTGRIICPTELNNLRLVGAYPLQNTDQILDAVKSSLPVHIWQVSDNVWRIDKRQ